MRISRWSAIAAFVAALVSSEAARAAPVAAKKKARVALSEAKGEIASAIEPAVRTALRPHPQVVLVPRKTWHKVASKLAYVKAARKLHLTSTLECVTGREGQAWTATVRVRDAANGNYVRTWKLSEASKPALLKRLESQLYKELGRALLRPGNMMPEPTAPPAADKTIAERAAPEKPGRDSLAGGIPLAGATPPAPPAAGTGAAQKAAAERPPAGKPLAEKPLAEKPPAEKPLAEKPPAERPLAEKPLAEKPLAEKPLAERPPAEKPAAEKPLAERPLAERPPAEKPLAEKPLAEKPLAEKPLAERPPAERSGHEKPPHARTAEAKPGFVGPPKSLKLSPAAAALARMLPLPVTRPGRRLSGLPELVGPPKPMKQVVRETAGATAEPASDGVRIETTPSPPRTATLHNQTPLEASIGFNYFTRSLSYKDDLFKTMRPYSLGGAPALRIEVAWYPAAHFTREFPKHIGLDLHADITPSIDSTDSSGVKFPTKTSSLEGGINGRWPFGEHELVLFLGGGRHSFEVNKSDRGVASNVPPVDYTFFRLALGARFQLTDQLSVRAQGAWRRIFSAGEIHSETWFPGAKLAGVDGSIIAGFEILPQIELQVGIEGRRYYYVLEPEPGDMYIVGGAIDQYWIGRAGLAFYLGAP